MEISKSKVKVTWNRNVEPVIRAKLSWKLERFTSN